ncbi:MAG: porin family protein [Pseudomonadales bacterium]
MKYLSRSIATAAIVGAWTLSPVASAAQPGPYVGAGVGIYTLDIEDINYDDSAALFRGFGGYRINDNWAIEADYQRFSEAEDDILGTDVKLDFEAWGVSVRPILPIGPIDLYARAGWTWYDAEANVGGFGSVDGSDDDFTWGGGVDFHLGDLLTLRGDISRIEIEDTDLNLVSAAILLKF